MEIRSVTLFVEPDFAPETVRDFIAQARTAFHVPVQTIRIATTCFPDWLQAPYVANARDFVARWQAAGVDYVSLGAVLLRHDAGWLDVAGQLIDASDVLFSSGEMADRNGQIDFGRIHHLTQLIQTLSTQKPNGFGNLYFTTLANCPPHSPFFPVAYNAGGNHFAIAVESADLARTAIQTANNLEDARQNLIKSIETETAKLEESAEKLFTAHRLPFTGIDFSLAPFPTDSQSLGGALEDLGAVVGHSGSLFAAAFVTDALHRAQFKKVGFNGLMLPVLEDSVLARRDLDVQNLLMYSAVCGVGLDTVPLAADVSAETLAAILLDTAALATRLDKPLTARLMPMPDKQAGDPITFDFPYFANSHVMRSPATLSNLLTQPDPVTLHAIHDRR